MKKLIVIGGLFLFLADVAIACQKRNKEKHDTEVSYSDYNIDKSIEKHQQIVLPNNIQTHCLMNYQRNTIKRFLFLHQILIQAEETL